MRGSPLAESTDGYASAAESTWLNGGAPAPNVPAWTGHGVDVSAELLSPYTLVPASRLGKFQIFAALVTSDGSPRAEASLRP